MYLTTDLILKLLFAVLAGGLVGAERELRDKAAGFRTLIFICVGSTLFTIFSLNLATVMDQARIAAGVVTGVGFLGAGVILRDKGRVTGLTTASTIWLVAALGMGIGAGQYAVVGAATAVVLVILWLFPYLETWIDNLSHTIQYHVRIPLDEQVYSELEDIFAASQLNVRSRKRMKVRRTMLCVWEVYGSPEHHEQLTERLMSHPTVIEFHM